jgi:thiamine-phosphate pyrophosphorylase
VINGQARLARDVEADGVHLGGGAGTAAEARAIMGRPAWVSVAAHTGDDVRHAVDTGADAVLVSPVFETRSPAISGSGVEKRPRGLDALREARAIAGHRVRIFALGGVTIERVRRCAEAGADGVAVLRALLASDRPGPVARVIHDALSLH